ncbi:hypothetical protein F511_21736 [Dorcoceras hygrometricum]|uniref:Uncharacterized protein n=1 Tax=Dorcoceras hygrometricum TaxID=472368 RepID=A0A2Z7BQL0_9LAMI|nr:hypothetical protein F511_21736 [Dorcoceras hygrometricum]
MANQIKRRNVSSLTYENFPGDHPSQYCSHPCTLNSTILPPRSIENASWKTRTPDLASHCYSPHGQPDQAAQRQQLDVRELPRRSPIPVLFSPLHA